MVRPCVASGFVNLADAVLHQCIRPLIGAWCAPGHHGYQRAFELISGQASNGPFGSPVFACAGKTDPPSSSHPLADLGGYSGRRLADPQAGIVRKIRGEGASLRSIADLVLGAVAELVGIEGGVVSGVINLESSGVEASDWRPRHDEPYHEA